MACKHPSMSTYDDHFMKMRSGSGAVHQNAFIVLTHSFLPCIVERAIKPFRSPCCSSRLTMHCGAGYQAIQISLLFLTPHHALWSGLSSHSDLPAVPHASQSYHNRLLTLA